MEVAPGMYLTAIFTPGETDPERFLDLISQERYIRAKMRARTRQTLYQFVSVNFDPSILTIDPSTFGTGSETSDFGLAYEISNWLLQCQLTVVLVCFR